MTTHKIPSSLKWLLTKKARLEGELLKIEHEGCAMQRIYQSAINKLNARIEVQDAKRRKYSHVTEARVLELKEQIKAVERTLQLHDIQVDTSAVMPIKTHDTDRVVPHGHVTRLVLDCLRKANGRVCPTTELVLYVAANSGREIEGGAYQQMHIAVKKRLGFLARNKIIRRHHPTTTYFEGKWSLPRSAFQGPSQDDLKGRFAPP